MFTTDMRKALATRTKPFLGRTSCTEISKMPHESQEERFALLVEALRYDDPPGTRVPAPKIGPIVPDYSEIARTKAELGTSAFNQSIFCHTLRKLITLLIGEFYDLSNGEPNFSALEGIADGEKNLGDFCKTTQEVNQYNKVFAFKGASGKEYSGKGVKDISKFKGDEILDIAKGIPKGTPDGKLVAYAVENEKLMKEEFKNFRIVLIALITQVMLPDAKESKVVTFVRAKVLEEGA